MGRLKKHNLWVCGFCTSSCFREEESVANSAGGAKYLKGDLLKIWRFVLTVFFVNKALILIPAFLATRYIIAGHPFLYNLSYLLTKNFYKWDSAWYGIIAKKGYFTDKGYYAALNAFFPLFPTLMYVVKSVTGSSLATAGVLISNGAFICALFWMFKLIQLDYEEKEVRKIIWLLALYPTSYYFSSAYTESLFFLFMVLTLYFIRTNKWAGAGVSGFFASGTRNIGVFLTLPFALEYFSIHRWSDAIHFLSKRLWRVKNDGWKFCWVFVIPASLFLYMLFLKVKFNDAFAFSHDEKKFGRGFMEPIQTLYNGYKAALVDFFINKSVFLFLDFFAVTLTIIVLVAMVRRMRLSYWIIILYAFLIPIMMPLHDDYFVSYSRYSLVIFPLFIGVYELVKRSRVLYAFTQVVFAVMLTILVYLWSQGRWIA